MQTANFNLLLQIFQSQSIIKQIYKEFFMLPIQDDIYTIVLTGVRSESSDIHNMGEYILQGDLYHSPHPSKWDGKGKIFHIPSFLAQKLKPDFNQTIEASIEPSKDKEGNIIKDTFEINTIERIEPHP